MGLALFVYNASAQWKVGVQTGYTHNSLSTESGYAYDRHYDALGGFTVGVPVQYEFANWFALQADLSYTQKNYALYRSGTYADVRSGDKKWIHATAGLHPFLFRGEKLRGFINAGAYMGYWIAKSDGRCPI